MCFSIHINNSPIVYSLAANYQAIAGYYAQTPQFEIGQNVFIAGAWMTPSDRANYYGLDRFDFWFSAVNRKIADGIITDPVADSAASALAKALVDGQISLREDCKAITRELFLRGYRDTLKQYLYLLTVDGIFDPITALLYQVEFTDLPRWRTLGLNNPPTEVECEQALAQ